MSASHNPPSDPRLDPELERLLNGHLTGTLDASEQAALQAHLDAADDATLDAVAVVLETEALLHWHHGAVRTFGEPVAVDAAASRETRRTVRPSRCLDSSSAMNGHAPWFSGSSCTHTSSASG